MAMERIRKLSVGSSLAITAGVSTAVAILIVASLLLTNPVAIGPQGVTAWFLFLLIDLTGWLTLLLYGAKRYLHLYTSAVERWRSSLRQGILVASLAVLLAALSSLQQLTWRDALLLVALALLIELYARLRST